MEQLSTCTSGRLLRQWHKQAAQLQDQQLCALLAGVCTSPAACADKAVVCRHWDMQLKGVQVQDVSLGPPGTPALLTATMHEKVQLLTSEGQCEQAFDQPTSFEFELMWEAGGAGWLMTDIRELQPAA